MVIDQNMSKHGKLPKLTQGNENANQENSLLRYNRPIINVDILMIDYYFQVFFSLDLIDQF